MPARAGTGCELAMLDRWGQQLEILTEYGLALKPHPSRGATHTGIEAALLLRDAIGNAEIVEIRAGASALAFAPLIQHSPASALEAKFSLRYCIAAALTQGVVGLRTFSDEVFRTQAIQDMVQRVRMEPDDRIRDDREFASVVTVHTATGAVHEQHWCASPWASRAAGSVRSNCETNSTIVRAWCSHARNSTRFFGRYVRWMATYRSPRYVMFCVRTPASHNPGTSSPILAKRTRNCDCIIRWAVNAVIRICT